MMSRAWLPEPAGSPTPTCIVIDSKRPTNRLAQETSPYLLQHASNPVDWYPWGTPAFERAVSEDKPILLSVGYSACHWCHVMERESFDNEVIAQQMNELFVCVKVDREERPDVDAVYMAATTALTGSGGWPMTVFLTPDGKPFFAGTYFPPIGRHGRPGFADLLKRVAELWQQDRESLVGQTQELMAAILPQRSAAGAGLVGQNAIDLAISHLRRRFDAKWGGFGAAPKFPPHGALSLLIRQVNRTDDPQIRTMIRQTLDAMAGGGIYDHLGGGFARYSTDARWLVPHFEKMLYDNAQLGRIFAEAAIVFGSPDYRRIARETFDYVLREMQDERGGFYSSTDADSEGEEGRFFVWTLDEITDELGPDTASQFAAYYDISQAGNWEEKNILNTPRTLEDVAAELALHPDDLKENLSRARDLLCEARAQRTGPELDDKVLTAWNGLMIGALAFGSRALREPRYLRSACRAAQFVLEELRDAETQLFRSWRTGRAHIPAFLEDYAYFCDALIDLFEAGASQDFLFEARRLAERMVQDFTDSDTGGFFRTTANHDSLIFRPRDDHDGALPSATAVAARVLVRLGRHFDEATLLERGESVVRSQASDLESSPHSALTMLSVVDSLLEPPLELTLVGTPQSPEYQALECAIFSHFLPNCTFAHHDPNQEQRTRALRPAWEKPTADGRAVAYVCREGSCGPPATTAELVATALKQAQASNAAERRIAVGVRRMSGFATPTGTAKRSARFAATVDPGSFRPLADTGLSVSALGVGGRRIGSNAADQRAATEMALKSGVNLIDTSSSFMDGQSEAILGQILAKLAATVEFARDEIVIVSKTGPIRGSVLQHAKAREQAGAVLPRIAKLSDTLWYSLDPSWLAEDLTRSLERLGLTCIDGYLLHEPELLLAHAQSGLALPPTQAKADLQRQLTRAFRHLETEVTSGRIRFYGVASNTCTAVPSDPEALELSRLVEAAHDAGGPAHHFKIIEVPLNLLEPAPLIATTIDSRPGAPLTAAAAGYRIAVFATRPLTAMWKGSVQRLCDPQILPQVSANTAIERLEAAEAQYRSVFAPRLRVSDGRASPESIFAWGPALQKIAVDAQSSEQVERFHAGLIVPRVAAAVHSLDRAFGSEKNDAWNKWRDGYLEVLAEAVTAVRTKAARRSQLLASALHEQLATVVAESQSKASLAQKALWLTSHQSGVTATIVGIRTPAQANEALACLTWAPPPPSSAADIITISTAMENEALESVE